MSEPWSATLEEVLRDHYTLERQLGRGGPATVYLAHDLKHDRPVALKVLRPEPAGALGPERFLRQTRLTALLLRLVLASASQRCDSAAAPAPATSFWLGAQINAASLQRPSGSPRSSAAMLHSPATWASRWKAALVLSLGSRHRDAPTWGGAAYASHKLIASARGRVASADCGRSVAKPGHGIRSGRTFPSLLARTRASQAGGGDISLTP